MISSGPAPGPGRTPRAALVNCRRSIAKCQDLFSARARVTVPLTVATAWTDLVLHVAAGPVGDALASMAPAHRLLDAVRSAAAPPDGR